LYWHIDRYDTLGAAKENAGPNSVVAAAHGAVWLMTVEPKTTRRHRLHHIAWVGPFKLPVDKRYAMRVQSSTLVPGGGTPVHTHSGPEAFYIVSGEQCIETPLATRRLTSGSAEFVPANTIHRGRITGNGPRRALAIVIYDATRPVSKNVVEAPQLASCD
jgi:quercetin dioxygenase-like cupin family protein